jgi:hypothetical protein
VQALAKYSFVFKILSWEIIVKIATAGLAFLLVDLQTFITLLASTTSTTYRATPGKNDMLLDQQGAVVIVF